MFFKKRPKRNGDGMAEKMNQDFDKQLWLKKVLSFDEFNSFLLAKESSMFITMIMQNKEPIPNRSKEAKKLIRNFYKEINKILRKHKKATFSERTKQVELLIRDANFRDDYQYSPKLYYHFSSLNNQERLVWFEYFQDLSKEFFGIED